MGKFLLFGANGAIGSTIAKQAGGQWDVIAVTRDKKTVAGAKQHIVYADPEKDADALANHGPYDAVCWAQGANANDSVYDVDMARHLDVYQANCLYILASLKTLLAKKLLAKPARLVIISSIWQNTSRQHKLSYTMSKAAIQGLVHSASIDLGVDGHMINAVMPGVLDTPMTRRNLQPEQVSKVENATKFGRLPTLEDVADLSCYLCSPKNNSITGQSIAVDLGFSNAHII